MYCNSIKHRGLLLMAPVIYLNRIGKKIFFRKPSVKGGMF